ncbi:hypothetical protein KVV02_007668 [Mortierella alpina]|uniref:G-protein coupled receptors family 3 profile domain-containing protein n=1 Tax=Mortierella alpina TaxID=64518 RepID=A0A9P8AC39_MORAP|nr:hypothetical protein KVV02_007668 [Mortierella alpina]
MLLNKRQQIPPLIPAPPSTTTSTYTEPARTTATSPPVYSPHIHDPPTSAPRPPRKPWLLTDDEYQNLWDPKVNTLRIGVLLSLNVDAQDREATLVRKALSAIRVAVEDVNTQQIIPGVNMSLVLRDSQDPSLQTSTGGSAAIAGVNGVIGDIRSELTSYEALMTSSVGISQCSFASGSTTLSDIGTYPYFFRTIPTIIEALDAILALIKHVGWKRIMVIYDIEYLGWAGREYLTSKARRMGIYSLANQPLTTAGVPFDPNFGFLKDTIQSTASRVQILLANDRLQRDVLREMRESGFMGPEYAWVTTNDLAEHYDVMEPHVEGYDGLIMLDNVWDFHGYPPYDNFVSRWQRLNTTEYPGAGDLEIENDEGMAYSCVMMLAHACGELVRHRMANKPSLQTDEELLRDIMSGYHASDIQVTKYFQTRTYEGPAGPIMLDQNGDQKYGLFNAFSLQDGKSIPFAYIVDDKYTALRDPPFKKSHPTLPRDAPPWAIQNPTWFNARGIIYGILCSIGILLTLISAFLVYFLRDNIIIKAASPTFCLCELLGILLVFVWCILMVGIPTTPTCIAQSLLLPFGITLLAGSLTIKNYRIYRIFNSVNVANQAFQTRLLLRFVVLVVLLALIPIIIELALDIPFPDTINIHADQWVRCRGRRHENWWVLASSIVPLLLILFGVYLAFKTRNVVYLWNEARQISLVLYNIFFFALLIVISLFFPDDLYTASFYIEICGTFFTNLLALSVLFYPKFWKIWKAYQRRRHHNPLDEHWQPSHHHRSHHKLRRPGDMTTGISSGNLMGINTATATAFGNMPDTIAPDAIATNGNVGGMPSKRSGHAASTGARAIAVTDSSSSTARDVTLNGKQRERPRPLKRGLSVNSSLGDRPPSVNLADWWMNTSVPIHRIASSTLSAHGGVGGTDNRLDEQILRGTFMNERDFQETLRRRSVERERDNGGEGSSGTLPARPSHVTFMPPSKDLGVFEEERAQHAPAEEAAIEEVDSDTPCTDGKSRSHLMLSMTQVVVENEPTIRVETCHSGTLLIRFRNQARLETWLGVFSPQDLATLMPSSVTVPDSSLASSVIVDNTGGLEDFCCNDATSSSIFMRTNSHLPKATQRRQSLSKHNRGEFISKGRMMPRLAEQSYPEVSEVNGIPTITTTSPPALPHVAGKDVGVGTRTESESMPGLDQTQSPQQVLQPQTWSDCSAAAAAVSLSSSNPYPADSDRTIIIPRGGKRQQITEQDVVVPASSPVIEAPIPLQVHPFISVTSATSASINGAEIHDNNNNNNDDDDDDDLYDPEFGIGGNGRRHYHSRCSITNQSRFNGSPQGRAGSISVPALRLTKSANGSPSLPHFGTIPSPAVISAAAAAVSAGWSECEALSAAMADPDGDFLTALQVDRREGDAQGVLDPRSLIHSHSADNAIPGKAAASKRHSLSPFSLFGSHQSRRQSRVEGGHDRRNSTGRSLSHSPRLCQSGEGCSSTNVNL